MKRTFSYIRNSLIDYYSHHEIESFISIIFNNIYNYSKNEIILNDGKILSEEEFGNIKSIVERLKKYHPIQYIFGNAEFYGLPIKVSPAVLIPRNETEELVDILLKKHRNEALRIIDMGTGSGCIPIALKKNEARFKLLACDISEEALELAKENAQMNNVEVEFFHYDILSEKSLDIEKVDVIISNPPYVTTKEKELMSPNVLENEPHLALFVPNNNPLLFYRAIVLKSNSMLSTNGEIYFEINEAYGDEVLQLMECHGFDAEILKDLNGKERMVIGQKKV